MERVSAPCYAETLINNFLFSGASSQQQVAEVETLLLNFFPLCDAAGVNVRINAGRSGGGYPRASES